MSASLLIDGVSRFQLILVCYIPTSNKTGSKHRTGHCGSRFPPDIKPINGVVPVTPYLSEASDVPLAPAALGGSGERKISVTDQNTKLQLLRDASFPSKGKNKIARP